jgi:hypothetical protein
MARFVKPGAEAVPHPHLAAQPDIGASPFDEAGKSHPVRHVVLEQVGLNLVRLENGNVSVPPGHLTSGRTEVLQEVLHAAKDVQVLPSRSDDQDLLSAIDSFDGEARGGLRLKIHAATKTAGRGGGGCEVGASGEALQKFPPLHPNSRYILIDSLWGCARGLGFPR